jgi:hypothetical protein
MPLRHVFSNLELLSLLVVYRIRYRNSNPANLGDANYTGAGAHLLRR